MKIILSLLFTILLSSCSANVVDEIENKSIERENLVRKYMAEAKLPKNKIKDHNIRLHDGIWLGSRAEKSRQGHSFSEEIENETITIASSSSMSLQELSSIITDITSINVIIDDDILNVNSASNDDSSVSSEGVVESEGIDQNGYPIASAIESSPFSSQVDPTNEEEGDLSMDINWSGDLTGLLNFISSRLNISWEYTGREIKFYKYLTRTYTLLALPSQTEIDSTLDAGSSNSESTAGVNSRATATQDISTESSINIWDEVQDTVEDIVDSNGRINLSKATGTITVTASPTTIDRVETYIEEINNKLSRQVVLDVEVYTISLNDSNEYGVDFDAIFNNDSVSFALSGAQSTLLGNATSMAWNIVDPSSELEGSAIILRSINEKGKVLSKSTAALTTMNNIPAPLQISRNQGYLAQIETTTTESGVTTTSLTPGTISTGLNFHFLPRILSEGKIMMQFGINISDLENIEVFNTNGSQIQLPTTESRGFIQQAIMQSGSTLILAGFEQNREVLNKSGALSEESFFFGGGHTGTKGNSFIIILVKPNILQVT